MILFYILAIVFFIYSIFAPGCLIEYMKSRDEHNKEIEKKIKYGRINYDSLFGRMYNKSDYRNRIKDISDWLAINIAFDILSIMAIFFLSLIISFFFKYQSYDYSFNINSLKDKVVTQGRLHGGMFAVRGTVDGEISYFYSRTMNYGEKVEHIPASKSYIKYSETDTPNIRVFKQRKEYPKWMDEVLLVNLLPNECLDHYEITVPNGTITTDGLYEINLE